MERQALQNANKPGDSIQGLAVTAGHLLSASGKTLATAESCTGGLLAGAVTAIAGSSAYFLGGVISYDNGVKVGVLGVAADLIDSHGAVSAEVAASMAYNAMRLFRADLALSVTGIAGPGGATPNKPVGTTFIALVSARAEEVRYFHFTGDRVGNRDTSVHEALAMLVSHLGEAVPVGGTPATLEVGIT